MSEHLEHHGIKGQKWGVQNGPPYPLDEEAKKDYNEDVSKGTDKTVVEKMSQTRDDDDLDPEEYLDNEAMSRNNFFNKRPVENLEDLSRLGPKDPVTGPNGARYRINNGSDNGEDKPTEADGIGRSYNCQNCAMAFDMVERGYDVRARPRMNGSNVGDIAKYFDGGKLEQNGNDYDWYTLSDEEMNQRHAAYQNATTRAELRKVEAKHAADDKRQWTEYQNACKKAVDDMEAKMLKNGNGARGIIVVGWPDGGIPSSTDTASSFHAFNWTVEKGDVIYYDAQSHREWKYSSGFTNAHFVNRINPNELYFMRTDNLQPSKNIGECVYSRTRKEDKKNDT